MNILTGSPKEIKGRCVLTVNPDGIPDVLKAERAWTPWKLVPRDGRKPAKVPIDIRTGRYLTDGFDPRKLVSFDEAFAYHRRQGWEGKGGVKFAFVGGRYAGLDLDECRDPSTRAIKPEAIAMLSALGTYAEVSPSGTGVKAIGIGQLLADGGHVGMANGLSIEVYDRVKWFALTGHRLDFAPATVNECEAEMRRVQALITKPKPVRAIPFTMNGNQDMGLGFRGSDDELVRRACEAGKGGALIRRLWSGDTTGYHSGSEALASLAVRLAFWTGPDEARLDRVMRQSELVRAYQSKWDERRKGESYGMVEVVRFAISTCANFYTGKRPAGQTFPIRGHGKEGIPAAVGAAPEKSHIENRPAESADEKSHIEARGAEWPTAEKSHIGTPSVDAANGTQFAAPVFQKPLSRVCCLLGETLFVPLHKAMNTTSADDVPPAETVFLKRTKTGKPTCGSGELVRFQHMCWRLAKRTAGGSFHLGVIAAAKEFGVTHTIIVRWLKWLAVAGVLTRLERGTKSSRLASRYVWTGKPVNTDPAAILPRTLALPSIATNPPPPPPVEPMHQPEPPPPPVAPPEPPAPADNLKPVAEPRPEPAQEDVGPKRLERIAFPYPEPKIDPDHIDAWIAEREGERVRTAVLRERCTALGVKAMRNKGEVLLYGSAEAVDAVLPDVVSNLIDFGRCTRRADPWDIPHGYGVTHPYDDATAPVAA